MWAVAGFFIVAGLGLLPVILAARRGAVRRNEYPWPLDEVSKLHVMIVGSLAGFAFTGVVLVVSLTNERHGSAQVLLDTVIVMFLVAFLYWVGSAFLISYMPHASGAGDLAQRVHFSLASTIEYRTVFLSWFALLPLLEANGFGRLAPTLYFLLPVSLFIGSLLLAMATDGLGLLSFGELYFSAALGTGLTLAYSAIVTFAVPGARSPYSALDLTIVLFCLNGAGFALAALTPLASKYSHLRRFYERHGRSIIVADVYVTMVALSFSWLTNVGFI